MEISQLGFVLLAVYSLCFGALLGVAYDVLRVTRVILGAKRNNIARTDLRKVILPVIKRTAYPEKSTRTGNILLDVYVAIGDVLFVSACGMLAVLIAYAYNSGKVRAVIFVGLIFGFLLYYNTVGRLVVKVSELVAFAVRCVAVYGIESVRFLIRKISKNIKIKKKGAKNDKQPNGKTKKAVLRKDPNRGRGNKRQSSYDSGADKLRVKAR